MIPTMAMKTDYDPALLPPPEADFDYPIEAVDPALIEPHYRRQVVEFDEFVKPGTIIVDPAAHFLYHVREHRQAVRYGVGVGRDGFAWSGTAEIRMKRRWPRWVPPKEMVARDERAAKWANGQPGGPGNPLGARALYLYADGKDTLYRIHGTVEPEIHRQVRVLGLRAHAERGCGRPVRAGCDRNPGHRARGVSFASGGLAVALDAEGEGDEEYAEDDGVAADDPDHGKGAFAGARDDEHAEEN